MDGVVSIIIGCYNGAKYIERCFNCIINQTYRNIEVVFGDDGSTDSSFQIAQQFIPIFERHGLTLKCFSQSNIGMVTNQALKIATGEYIAVYDVDDILYPTSIEKRVFFMIDHPEYACVRTNGYKLDQYGNKELFSANEAIEYSDDIFEDLLLGRTYNWAGSYMVRREALNKVYNGYPVFETHYGANLQVLLATAYNNKTGYIDEPLMEYMYNTDSITHSDINYASDKNRYLGFKAIREAILDQLNIRNKYQQQIDIMYGEILLDLALTYNKELDFISEYEKLREFRFHAKTIHTYYYHKFKNNIIAKGFFRVLLAVKTQLSRCKKRR